MFLQARFFLFTPRLNLKNQREVDGNSAPIETKSNLPGTRRFTLRPYIHTALRYPGKKRRIGLQGEIG